MYTFLSCLFKTDEDFDVTTIMNYDGRLERLIAENVRSSSVHFEELSCISFLPLN